MQNNDATIVSSLIKIEGYAKWYLASFSSIAAATIHYGAAGSETNHGSK